MTIYKGIFGPLYAVNQHGVVCVKPDGSEWRASHYSVEGFQDAIDRGYMTEVVDDQGVN